MQRREKQEAERGEWFGTNTKFPTSQWCRCCLRQHGGKSTGYKDTQLLAFREQQVEESSPGWWWPVSLLMHCGESWPLALHWAPPLMVSTPHAPLLTSLELSSTVTRPLLFLGMGLITLPFPTLVHLSSFLFQVNQPSFLASTHILQPMSSSSYQSLPSLHWVLLSPHSLVLFSTIPEKDFHYEPNSSPHLTWPSTKLPSLDFSGNTLYTFVIFSLFFVSFSSSVPISQISVIDKVLTLVVFYYTLLAVARWFNPLPWLQPTAVCQWLPKLNTSPEMTAARWKCGSGALERCLNFHLPTIIFTWMCHRHFKFSTSKTNLSLSPPPNVLPPVVPMLIPAWTPLSIPS